MKKKQRVAILEIRNCCDCPYVKAQRHYSADSFEMSEDFFCKKKNDKYLANLDWHEKVIAIPEWCPLTERKK